MDAWRECEKKSFALFDVAYRVARIEQYVIVSSLWPWNFGEWLITYGSWIFKKISTYRRKSYTAVESSASLETFWRIENLYLHTAYRRTKSVIGGFVRDYIYVA